MIDFITIVMGVVLAILCAYWFIAMAWCFATIVLQALGYTVTIEKEK